jgi:hypothetical protein
MLLRTLQTRDFDELAEEFPWWKLRFRQFGRGPFRGQLQSLQSEGTLVFQLSVNRMIHIEGWPPPDSFGCFPVLAANEHAIWHGRRLKVGQVRVFDPGQDTDHLTAPVHYHLVGLTVASDIYRQEVPVLGGFDQEERRVGREVIAANPAYCRALRSQLVGLFDLVRAQPARFAQNSQGIEQECLRRFARLLARPDDDRTARQPSNRARLIRRAEDYLQANHRMKHIIRCNEHCPCHWTSVSK